MANYDDITPPAELVQGDYASPLEWATALYQAGYAQAAADLARRWPTLREKALAALDAHVITAEPLDIKLVRRALEQSGEGVA